MSNAHLLQRNRYYESLRGIGCPHHLAQSIVDTYIHAYECASSEIAENTRLKTELADGREALRLGNIGGIYDDFHGLADAIGQMTTHILERERRCAQLEDDLAAIKARRCETCGYYVPWPPEPTKGVCKGLLTGTELGTAASSFCSQHKRKEAADA